MKDDLLSAPVEGGREILSGLAAWLAGLTWGYALLTGDMLWELRGGEWMVGWLGAVFLPPGMSGWGWLAFPFELVMLYGAVWRGWNACLVIGLLALAAGLLALPEYGPWYLLRLILPLLLVLFGIAVERGWFIPRRRPPKRGPRADRAIQEKVWPRPMSSPPFPVRTRRSASLPEQIAPPAKPV